MIRKNLVVSLALLMILLLSIAMTNQKATNSSFLEKRAVLTIREIGHKLLLSIGDSSSRVLPVKQIKKGVFQLEFQNHFPLIPDTLTTIVKKSLANADLQLNYMVNTFSCTSEEMVYAFEINSNQNDIVPCLGRMYDSDCYLIQISFTDYPDTSNNHLYVIATALGLSLIGFIGVPYFNERKKVKKSAQDAPIILGKYSFDIDKQILKSRTETIKLSEKESKLLSILVIQQNQLVTRERLLKEVWEDEGVFTGRSLDMFISKLRKKLKNDSTIQVANSHGRGYILKVGKEV